MTVRIYLLITGVIFGLVALMHLSRVVNGGSMVVGPLSFPMWVSWFGTVVPALLSGWALSRAARGD